MDDFFDNPLYRLTKLAMQVVGLWPYQKFSTRVIILTIVFLDILCATIAMMWYLVDEFSNTTEMVNCLPALFMCYVAYIALAVNAANFNKFKTTLDFMKVTSAKLQIEEEKITLRKYAKTGQYIGATLIGIATTASTLYTNLPLLTLAFNTLFVQNGSQSMDTILKLNFYNLDPDKYFIPIYLYSFQVVYPIVHLTVVYNQYIVVVISYACGMFAILGQRIENIGDRYRERHNTVASRELDTILLKNIETCVHYHWDCLRFSQLIEDSLTYLWLMELFGNSLMITVTAVQAVVNLDKPFYMISFTLQAAGVAIQLICITWTSHQLLDHSHQLGDIIYNINWYDFPPRLKKSLLVMLMRSSKPCKITAGRMIDLNLETFCMFLKLSTSYFTLVLSTQ